MTKEEGLRIRIRLKAYDHKVYKKGGETFEMRVHKRLIDITNASPKTIDSLQNLSLPAGVDAEIRM